MEPGTYTIVVPIVGSAAAAIQTGTSVLEHAANAQRLRFVGAAADLQQLRRNLPDGVAAEFVETPARPTLSAAFRQIVAVGLDEDVLFVSSGIAATPAFDLRLQWSAYSAEAIAAVSPLCDVDPMTSLERHGVGGGSPVDVDLLLPLASRDRALEAPGFLPECVYLRADQVRSVTDRLSSIDFRTVSAALHRHGRVQAIAPHVLVGTNGLRCRQTPWLDDSSVQVFLDESPLNAVAASVVALLGRNERPMPIAKRIRRRHLHVMHSWGGGLERWVQLFCDADAEHDNFVLKSIGERGRVGSQLWLYAGIRASEPIRIWQLPTPISGTAITHLTYQKVLREIIEELGIDVVLVSSLIGHSLDVLRTGVRTLLVCHDYYPFCPALSIYFGGVCRSCGAKELKACFAENPLNHFFANQDTDEWIALREAFLRALVESGTSIVAPSPSVEGNYKTLLPGMERARFNIVAHGNEVASPVPVPCRADGEDGPLRVVVLGRLTFAKGAGLLAELLPEIRDFAEISLVGCGEEWSAKAPAGLSVIPSYELSQLHTILADIKPDVALLLSIVPETFSFTLEECFSFAIPPLAINVGSFGDRIDDGVTGFLCEPTAAAVGARLRWLADNRPAIESVRQRLSQTPRRTTVDMVRNYDKLIGLPKRSSHAYFSNAWNRGTRSSPLAETSSGYQLIPYSQLGFADFLRQMEDGFGYYIRNTQQLGGWQKRLMLGLFRAAFRTMRSASNSLRQLRSMIRAS